VRREGRLTAAQRVALDTLWERHGLAARETLRCIGTEGSCCLEIGCGSGEVLLALADRRPDILFLGAEVYRPGLGRVLRNIEARGIANIKLLAEDVWELLDSASSGPWLDRLLAFFPDPWPKSRHHKRRLINQAFVDRVGAVVRPQGRVALATDDPGYAAQMLRLFDGPDWQNLAGRGRFAPRPRWRPVSRYEMRARRLGHTVFELAFCRTGP
jgi:tRNA (guanine-N7-)-methyltransferase